MCLFAKHGGGERLFITGDHFACVTKCESKYCNMSMSGPVFLPPGVVPNFDKYNKFITILSVSRVFTLKGQIKYFVFMKRKKQDLKNITQMDSIF